MHPNIIKTKTKNISKEIRIFPKIFSPDDIHTSNKRYEDHFTDKNKGNNSEKENSEDRI